MRKLFVFIIILLFISACALKKVEKNHGVIFLSKKQEQLFIKKSNINDVISLLGPPSTKSFFDKDLWIYIERQNDHSTIKKLGKEEIVINNVLILEINEKGLLEKKELLDINSMKNLEFTKETTKTISKKNTFIYDFLSSLRQKINDPLNKRKR